MAALDFRHRRSRPRPHLERWIPWLALLGTGALLALSTNLAKVAVGVGLGPLALLTWSLSGAAVALGVLGTITRRLAVPDRATRTYLVVAALLGVVAPNLILYSAVPVVGVSFVALAIAFPPLLTYVGALVLRLEGFVVGRALGVLLALAGGALLATLSLRAPEAPTSWILATLFAPVILAAGNLYRTLRWPAGARSEELAVGMLVVASTLLLVVGTAGGFSLHVPTAGLAPLLLIGLQTAAFALQYLLFFVLQRTGGPVVLSLMGSVAALIGVPVALLLLGETAPEGLVPAAVLVLSGVLLVAWGGRRRNRPPNPIANPAPRGHVAAVPSTK